MTTMPPHPAVGDPALAAASTDPKPLGPHSKFATGVIDVAAPDRVSNKVGTVNFNPDLIR
jgi:hypothetical protein